jgi:cytochrome c oxidase subunit I
MSITASPATSAAVDQAAFGDDALDVVESWVATTDHRRLGRIHLGATLLAGTVGAVLMAFVGQRLDAALRGALGSGSWLGESGAAGFSFGRIFNAAQTGLVVVVAVPMFLALASIVVPRQIGATRLAFPRMHSFVVWSYLMGAALYITSFLLVTGPPSVNIFDTASNLITGKQANKATDVFLGALALITISTFLGFINIFTTVLTHRRAGLSLQLVRPFTWASFVTAAVSIITIPAHLAGLLILYIDQHFGGTFGSTEGSEFVWSHLVRFTTRPDMYLLVIPALGLVGEIVVSRTGRPLLGGSVPSYLVGIAGAFSLFAWLGGGTAVDTFMQPTNRWFTSLIVLPIALLILVWLGSLAGGFKPDVSLLGALGVPLLLVLAAVNVLIAAARGLDGLTQGAPWLIGQTFLLAIALPVVAGVFGIAELAPLALGRSLPKPLAGLAGLSALGGGVLGAVGFAALANRDNATSSAPGLSALVLVGGLGLAAGLGLTLLGLLGASRLPGSDDAAHLVPFIEENH